MYRRSTFLISLVLVLYSAVNAQANLVGHWQFEGNFNDSSGNGNDATAHGDVAIVNDPERGQVAILDGNGDYIEIPHSNSLNITSDQISLAAWVYFDDVSGPPEIIIAKVFNNTTHTNPYFSYGLHILTNGQPRFWQSLAGGTANIPAPSGQFFQSKQWYHLAGVYDGSAMTLYINGQAVAVRNVSGAINGYNSLLRLGTNGGLTEQMSGKLDDVRIYSRAMSAEQVRNLFNGTAPSWLQAQDPVPANGAIHSDTWVNLSWLPGDNAVTHNVYLGDNFDDVNAGAEGTFQGNHTGTFLVAGFPGFPFPDGLIPGTTYYWRIDEVNDTEPNSPWKGPVWSFGIPPRTAYNPIPAKGAESVETDVTLSWTGGFGSKLHTVYFGDNFDDVNNAAGGLPQGTATYIPGPLELAKTYYWRVDEFDVIEMYKGDIWSFTTEGAVGNPNPANGAVDVKQTQIISWSPSVFAASHELYFGTDKDAVKNADTGSPEYKGTRDLGAESYDPGKLEWDSTYYWRIDEVNKTNPDSPWPGILWSFTTADFLIVDDFESYNDLDPADPESNRIFNAWIDGYDNQENGSLVGYDTPPFAEQTIVHEGNQSMPLYYENSVGYSEATMTLTYPRDWTENGVNKLTIWFRGNSDNTAETLYVALNGNAVVTNDNPDAAQVGRWTEWNIDLQAFADQGVNLANVDTISLGLGNKNKPLAGGSGTMYFDDIRLYLPAQPEAPEGLIGLWNFDEGSGAVAGDSSGNGLDGAISGAAWVSPGADGAGSALDFDGQGTNRVSLGTFDVVGDGLTIAMWCKADNLDTPGNDPRLFSKAIGGNNDQHWFMISSGRQGSSKVFRFRLKTDGTTGELKASTEAGFIDLDVWTHVAAVWDGAAMRLYKNGGEVGSLEKGGTLSTNPDAKVSIGNQPEGIGGDRPWDGQIDNVRLYNRALSVDEISELAVL